LRDLLSAWRVSSGKLAARSKGRLSCALTAHRPDDG
jgi:hypothetical protein